MVRSLVEYFSDVVQAVERLLESRDMGKGFWMRLGVAGIICFLNMVGPSPAVAEGMISEDARREMAALVDIHSIAQEIHQDVYDFVVYYDLVQEIVTRDISREDAIAKRAMLQVLADERRAHFRNLQEDLNIQMMASGYAPETPLLRRHRAHLAMIVDRFDAYHRYWDDLIALTLDRKPGTRLWAQQQMRGQLLALAVAHDDLIQQEIDRSEEGSVGYWYHTALGALLSILETFNDALNDILPARGLPQRQLVTYYQTALAASVVKAHEARKHLDQALQSVDEGDVGFSLRAAYQAHISVLYDAIDRTEIYTIGFLNPAAPIDAMTEINHLLAIEEMLLRDHAFRLARYDMLANSEQ